MKLFKRSKTPEQFWDWFLANLDSLRSIKSPNDKPFKEFRKNLDAVQEGLAFEMGQFDENTFHIIISAEGVADYFHAVHALRNTAPPLPSTLKIDFFRQPEPGVDTIEMNGLRLSKSEIYYTVEKLNNLTLFELKLYMPSDALTDLGKGMSFILLDKSIGEELVVSRIGPIEWLDANTKPADAKRLEHLLADISIDA